MYEHEYSINMRHIWIIYGIHVVIAEWVIRTIAD